MTAVNTISDTTRGLVSAKKDFARPSRGRKAECSRSSMLKMKGF